MYKNYIKYLRTVLNITEEELARNIGISSKSVHNIETGKTCPNLVTANKIKNALFCDRIEDVFPTEEYS